MCVCFFIANKKSNKADDFAAYIQDCLDNQIISAGDILVLDNAPIHTSESLKPMLESLMQQDIGIVYLPAYCPELNAIEMVFAIVKRWMRQNLNTSVDIITNVDNAFKSVKQHVIRKCIYHTIYYAPFETFNVDVQYLNKSN